MEITGPVAPETPPESGAPKGGCLAGCASGCATLVGLAVLAVGTITTTAFELVQPHQRARASVPDGACALEWWRSAGGGARYRVTCDAKRDLEITRFKLLSGPKGVRLDESVEGWGQPPWEDQRPLSGETITVEAGRTWTYDGTLSLGPVPWVGPPGTVTLTLLADEQPLSMSASE